MIPVNALIGLLVLVTTTGTALSSAAQSAPQNGAQATIAQPQADELRARLASCVIQAQLGDPAFCLALSAELSPAESAGQGTTSNPIGRSSPRTQQVAAIATSAAAVALARSGQLDRAETLMQNSLAQAPQQPEVLLNAASLAIFQGRFASSLALLEQLQGFQYPELYFNRAIALRALGRYEDAAASLAAYRQALGLAPQIPARDARP